MTTLTCLGLGYCAEHFVAAMDARKPVYQEKAMAFTVDHAKLMRTAWERAGKPVVQVGHQACSSGQVATLGAGGRQGRVGSQSRVCRGVRYRETLGLRPRPLLWKFPQDRLAGPAPFAILRRAEEQQHAFPSIVRAYIGGEVRFLFCA